MSCAPTSPPKGEGEEPLKITDPRVLVLASLLLQVILIATGNRRKYIKNKMMRIILWLPYLAADYIATLALGVLSRAETDSAPKYTITAFWAPFLLMHLGGPDTITAYAMADNELWIRHSLGLLTQASIAGYVFYRSFRHARLNYLSLVIALAGAVKYGERCWMLYSSSKDRYRDSLVSKPDPGPDYAKFMDELVSREREGYTVSLDKAIDNNFSSSQVDSEANGDHQRIEDDAFLLQEAYSFFQTFEKLFADLILSFQDREMSVSFFRDLQWRHAFSTVEIELGLIFDLFYTKWPLIFSRVGAGLRAVSCLSIAAALVAFPFTVKDDRSKIDGKIKEDVDYPEAEVIITYILLIGAVSLELYAVLILFLSDRMMIKLEKDWTTRPEAELPTFMSLLYPAHVVPARKRWSNSMGQYNVFAHCLKYMPNRAELWYPEKLDQLLEKHLRSRNEPVPDHLKELIFNELKERAKGGPTARNWRDRILLEEMNSFLKNEEVEFDQSLVIWHMATDICCIEGESALSEDVKKKRKRCSLLSDYMVHLLIMSPFMLPSGIGQIRFQDTIAEATELFKYEVDLDREKMWNTLSKVDSRFIPSDVKGDRSKSLLFDAQRLVKDLNKIEDASQRWDKITKAWLDMLTFAAAQCSWSDHAEKLSQGGELLTHVWLLMAHFGMTDKFQISKGFIRAKLVSK